MNLQELCGRRKHQWQDPTNPYSTLHQCHRCEEYWVGHAWRHQLIWNSLQSMKPSLETLQCAFLWSISWWLSLRYFSALHEIDMRHSVLQPQSLVCRMKCLIPKDRHKNAWCLAVSCQSEFRMPKPTQTKAKRTHELAERWLAVRIALVYHTYMVPTWVCEVFHERSRVCNKHESTCTVGWGERHTNLICQGTV